MLLYYRMLGLVIWAGLLLAAGALYTLTCWLGSSIGLTLTLSGVTGIIVSVGITVDSYVVYFERLKDEVRSGKTIRSSLDRGFSRSFRTILAADFVSLIGAALLYFLAVGSVRGFAFFLGISVLLDIFVAYFFMHPLVSIIGRKPAFTKARWLGISSGLGDQGGDGMSLREQLARHLPREDELRLHRSEEEVVRVRRALVILHRSRGPRRPGPEPRDRLQGRDVLGGRGRGQEGQ